MDTSENPKIMNMRGFGFFHNESEKLLVQNEAEYFYGAFGLLFYEDFIKDSTPHPPRHKIRSFSGFSIGSKKGLYRNPEGVKNDPPDWFLL